MRKLTVFLSIIVFIFACFCISINLSSQTQDTEEQMYTTILCKSCHFGISKIWKEWEETTHAKSWKDEEFKKLAKGNPKGLECGSCHSPKPIMITGLGKIPLIREDNRDFGVSCVVCHLGNQGAMHGPEPTKEPSLHGSIIRPPAEAVKLCSTCHGQKNLQELCAGDNNPVDLKVALQNKMTCMQCHMPEVEKPRKRSMMSMERVKERKHIWLSHEPSVYKEAAKLDINVENDLVTVSIINNTSHSLPTEKGSKLKLVVNVKGEKDELIVCKQNEFTKDLDTQIKVNEENKLDFNVEKPFQKIDAQLSYMPSPNMTKLNEFIVVKENYIKEKE